MIQQTFLRPFTIFTIFTIILFFIPINSKIRISVSSCVILMIFLHLVHYCDIFAANVGRTPYISTYFNELFDINAANSLLISVLTCYISVLYLTTSIFIEIARFSVLEVRNLFGPVPNLLERLLIENVVALILTANFRKLRVSFT